MDRGYDPFFVEHYEEFRCGHFRKKKPRLPTETCVYDKYWVCFDLTRCTWCRHSPLSKTIREYHEGN